MIRPSVRPLAGLRLLLPLALLAQGTLAKAQEPWSTGFRLVAGSFSGATDAGLGQEKNYGVAMWGAYPISARGSLEFEAGYRFFPGATYSLKSLSLQDKTDGYYGGAFYRHSLWFEGFYLQAGMRVWAMKSTETSTVDNGDGTFTKVETRGPGGTSMKPVFGAGLRMNQHYSVSLNAAQAEFKNAAGASKSGTLLEAALTIHF